MTKVSACVVLSALLLTCAGFERPVRPGGSPSPSKTRPVPVYQHLWREGWRQFQAGRYREAVQALELAHREAVGAGDLSAGVQIMSGMASCHLAMYRYRQAAEIYLRARGVAESLQDWRSVRLLCVNLSAAYLQMGEHEAAAQAASRGLAAGGGAHHDFQAQLWIDLGLARARQGQPDAAMPLIFNGIRAAGESGDYALQAMGWDYLGRQYLRQGRFILAETAIVEAFRLRRMHRESDLFLSYPNLGMLRLAQGDLPAAQRLLDRAVDLAVKTSNTLPIWGVYHKRGQARLAAGRLEEAYDDFRRALDFARSSRAEMLDLDAFQVSADVGLHHLSASFVEAGAALYFRTGRPEFALETLEALESNRASDLRHSFEHPRERLERLPPEYWHKLSELRRLERQALGLGTHEARDKVRRVNLELLEMEALAGEGDSQGASPGRGPRNLPRSRNLLAHLQRRLGAGRALLSFHLSEPESFLWAVTRDALTLHRLPPRSVLAARIAEFQQCVERGEELADELGWQLYRLLFGNVSPLVESKPDWVVVPDQSLFEAPLAALVVSREGGEHAYLVEKHSLQLLPSAWMLRGAQAELRGPFLGIGDPVFHKADPRWRAAYPGQGSWKRLLGRVAWRGKSGAQSASPLLARLPASAREIRACAQAWDSKWAAPLLMEGFSANLGEFRRALESRPPVIHWATHFLPPAEGAAGASIVLSLQEQGEPDILTPVQVSRLHLEGGVVVLSGCHSGAGQIRPGAGLLGLTRAWLHAGAQTVAATHWQTPDDSGEMFSGFYQHLYRLNRASGRPPAAAALQRAQIAMLRSDSWRSKPKYWAAYFIFSKD